MSHFLTSALTAPSGHANFVLNAQSDLVFANIECELRAASRGLLNNDTNSDFGYYGSTNTGATFHQTAVKMYWAGDSTTDITDFITTDIRFDVRSARTAPNDISENGYLNTFTIFLTTASHLTVTGWNAHVLASYGNDAAMMALAVNGAGGLKPIDVVITMGGNAAPVQMGGTGSATVTLQSTLQSSALAMSVYRPMTYTAVTRGSGDSTSTTGAFRAFEPIFERGSYVGNHTTSKGGAKAVFDLTFSAKLYNLDGYSFYKSTPNTFSGGVTSGTTVGAVDSIYMHLYMIVCAEGAFQGVDDLIISCEQPDNDLLADTMFALPLTRNDITLMQTRAMQMNAGTKSDVELATITDNEDADPDNLVFQPSPPSAAVPYFFEGDLSVAASTLFEANGTDYDMTLVAEEQTMLSFAESPLVELLADAVADTTSSGNAYTYKLVLATGTPLSGTTEIEVVSVFDDDTITYAVREGAAEVCDNANDTWTVDTLTADTLDLSAHTGDYVEVYFTSASFGVSSITIDGTAQAFFPAQVVTLTVSSFTRTAPILMSEATNAFPGNAITLKEITAGVAFSASAATTALGGIFTADDSDNENMYYYSVNLSDGSETDATVTLSSATMTLSAAPSATAYALLMVDGVASGDRITIDTTDINTALDLIQNAAATLSMTSVIDVYFTADLSMRAFTIDGALQAIYAGATLVMTVTHPLNATVTISNETTSTDVVVDSTLGAGVNTFILPAQSVPGTYTATVTGDPRITAATLDGVPLSLETINALVDINGTTALSQTVVGGLNTFTVSAQTFIPAPMTLKIPDGNVVLSDVTHQGAAICLMRPKESWTDLLSAGTLTLFELVGASDALPDVGSGALVRVTWDSATPAVADVQVMDTNGDGVPVGSHYHVGERLYIRERLDHSNYAQIKLLTGMTESHKRPMTIEAYYNWSIEPQFMALNVNDYDCPVTAIGIRGKAAADYSDTSLTQDQETNLTITMSTEGGLTAAPMTDLVTILKTPKTQAVYSHTSIKTMPGSGEVQDAFLLDIGSPNPNVQFQALGYPAQSYANLFSVNGAGSSEANEYRFFFFDTEDPSTFDVSEEDEDNYQPADLDDGTYDAALTPWKKFGSEKSYYYELTEDSFPTFAGSVDAVQQHSSASYLGVDGTIHTFESLDYDGQPNAVNLNNLYPYTAIAGAYGTQSSIAISAASKFKLFAQAEVTSATSPSWGVYDKGAVKNTNKVSDLVSLGAYPLGMLGGTYDSVNDSIAISMGSPPTSSTTISTEVAANGLFSANTLDLGDLYPGAPAGDELLIVGVVHKGTPLLCGVELYALQAVDLSVYALAVDVNGVETLATIALSGSLSAGETLFVTNDSASFATYLNVPSTATILEETSLSLDGTDPVVLYKNTYTPVARTLASSFTANEGILSSVDTATHNNGAIGAFFAAGTPEVQLAVSSFSTQTTVVIEVTNAANSQVIVAKQATTGGGAFTYEAAVQLTNGTNTFTLDPLTSGGGGGNVTDTIASVLFSNSSAEFTTISVNGALVNPTVTLPTTLTDLDWDATSAYPPTRSSPRSMSTSFTNSEGIFSSAAGVATVASGVTTAQTVEIIVDSIPSNTCTVALVETQGGIDSAPVPLADLHVGLNTYQLTPTPGANGDPTPSTTMTLTFSDSGTTFTTLTNNGNSLGARDLETYQGGASDFSGGWAHSNSWLNGAAEPVFSVSPASLTTSNNATGADPYPGGPKPTAVTHPYALSLSSDGLSTSSLSLDVESFLAAATEVYVLNTPAGQSDWTFVAYPVLAAGSNALSVRSFSAAQDIMILFSSDLTFSELSEGSTLQYPLPYDVTFTMLPLQDVTYQTRDNSTGTLSASATLFQNVATTVTITNIPSDSTADVIIPGASSVLQVTQFDVTNGGTTSLLPATHDYFIYPLGFASNTSPPAVQLKATSALEFVGSTSAQVPTNPLAYTTASPDVSVSVSYGTNVGYYFHSVIFPSTASDVNLSEFTVDGNDELVDETHVLKKSDFATLSDDEFTQLVAANALLDPNISAAQLAYGTTATLSTSGLFTLAGSGNYIADIFDKTVDVAASQNAISIKLTVTSLPAGGATWKTKSSKSANAANPTNDADVTLVPGLNELTLAPTAYARDVQVVITGDVQFSSHMINDVAQSYQTDVDTATAVGSITGGAQNNALSTAVLISTQTEYATFNGLLTNGTSTGVAFQDLTTLTTPTLPDGTTTQDVVAAYNDAPFPSLQLTLGTNQQMTCDTVLRLQFSTKPQVVGADKKMILRLGLTAPGESGNQGTTVFASNGSFGNDLDLEVDVSEINANGFIEVALSQATVASTNSKVGTTANITAGMPFVEVDGSGDVVYEDDGETLKTGTAGYLNALGLTAKADAKVIIGVLTLNPLDAPVALAGPFAVSAVQERGEAYGTTLTNNGSITASVRYVVNSSAVSVVRFQYDASVSDNFSFQFISSSIGFEPRDSYVFEKANETYTRKNRKTYAEMVSGNYGLRDYGPVQVFAGDDIVGYSDGTNGNLRDVPYLFEIDLNTVATDSTTNTISNYDQTEYYTVKLLPTPWSADGDLDYTNYAAAQVGGFYQYSTSTASGKLQGSYVSTKDSDDSGIIDSDNEDRTWTYFVVDPFETAASPEAGMAYYQPMLYGTLKVAHSGFSQTTYQPEQTITHKAAAAIPNMAFSQDANTNLTLRVDPVANWGYASITEAQADLNAKKDSATLELAEPGNATLTMTYDTVLIQTTSTTLKPAANLTVSMFFETVNDNLVFRFNPVAEWAYAHINQARDDLNANKDLGVLILNENGTTFEMTYGTVSTVQYNGGNLLQIPIMEINGQAALHSTDAAYIAPRGVAAGATVELQNHESDLEIPIMMINDQAASLPTDPANIAARDAAAGSTLALTEFLPLNLPRDMPSQPTVLFRSPENATSFYADDSVLIDGINAEIIGPTSYLYQYDYDTTKVDPQALYHSPDTAMIYLGVNQQTQVVTDLSGFGEEIDSTLGPPIKSTTGTNRSPDAKLSSGYHEFSLESAYLLPPPGRSDAALQDYEIGGSKHAEWKAAQDTDIQGILGFRLSPPGSQPLEEFPTVNGQGAVTSPASITFNTPPNIYDTAGGTAGSTDSVYVPLYIEDTAKDYLATTGKLQHIKVEAALGHALNVYQEVDANGVAPTSSSVTLFPSLLMDVSAGTMGGDNHFTETTDASLKTYLTGCQVSIANSDMVTLIQKSDGSDPPDLTDADLDSGLDSFDNKQIELYVQKTDSNYAFVGYLNSAYNVTVTSTGEIYYKYGNGAHPTPSELETMSYALKKYDTINSSYIYTNIGKGGPSEIDIIVKSDISAAQAAKSGFYNLEIKQTNTYLALSKTINYVVFLNFMPQTITPTSVFRHPGRVEHPKQGLDLTAGVGNISHMIYADAVLGITGGVFLEQETQVASEVDATDMTTTTLEVQDINSEPLDAMCRKHLSFFAQQNSLSLTLANSATSLTTDAVVTHTSSSTSAVQQLDPALPANATPADVFAAYAASQNTTSDDIVQTTTLTAAAMTDAAFPVGTQHKAFPTGNETLTVIFTSNGQLFSLGTDTVHSTYASNASTLISSAIEYSATRVARITDMGLGVTKSAVTNSNRSTAVMGTRSSQTNSAASYSSMTLVNASASTIVTHHVDMTFYAANETFLEISNIDATDGSILSSTTASDYDLAGATAPFDLSIESNIPDLDSTATTTAINDVISLNNFVINGTPVPDGSYIIADDNYDVNGTPSYLLVLNVQNDTNFKEVQWLAASSAFFRPGYAEHQAIYANKNSLSNAAFDLNGVYWSQRGQGHVPHPMAHHMANGKINPQSQHYQASYLEVVLVPVGSAELTNALNPYGVTTPKLAVTTTTTGFNVSFTGITPNTAKAFNTASSGLEATLSFSNADGISRSINLLIKPMVYIDLPTLTFNSDILVNQTASDLYLPVGTLNAASYPLITFTFANIVPEDLNENTLVFNIPTNDYFDLSQTTFTGSDVAADGTLTFHVLGKSAFFNASLVQNATKNGGTLMSLLSSYDLPTTLDSLTYTLTAGLDNFTTNCILASNFLRLSTLNTVMVYNPVMTDTLTLKYPRVNFGDATTNFTDLASVSAPATTATILNNAFVVQERSGGAYVATELQSTTTHKSLNATGAETSSTTLTAAINVEDVYQVGLDASAATAVATLTLSATFSTNLMVRAIHDAGYSDDDYRCFTIAVTGSVATVNLYDATAQEDLLVDPAASVYVASKADYEVFLSLYPTAVFTSQNRLETECPITIQQTQSAQIATPALGVEEFNRFDVSVSKKPTTQTLLHVESGNVHDETGTAQTLSFSFTHAPSLTQETTSNGQGVISNVAYPNETIATFQPDISTNDDAVELEYKDAAGVVQETASVATLTNASNASLKAFTRSMSLYDVFESKTISSSQTPIATVVVGQSKVKKVTISAAVNLTLFEIICLTYAGDNVALTSTVDTGGDGVDGYYTETPIDLVPSTTMTLTFSSAVYLEEINVKLNTNFAVIGAFDVTLLDDDGAALHTENISGNTLHDVSIPIASTIYGNDSIENLSAGTYNVAAATATTEDIEITYIFVDEVNAISRGVVLTTKTDIADLSLYTVNFEINNQNTQIQSIGAGPLAANSMIVLYSGAANSQASLQSFFDGVSGFTISYYSVTNTNLLIGAGNLKLSGNNDTVALKKGATTLQEYTAGTPSYSNAATYLAFNRTSSSYIAYESATLGSTIPPVVAATTPTLYISELADVTEKTLPFFATSNVIDVLLTTQSANVAEITFPYEDALPTVTLYNVPDFAALTLTAERSAFQESLIVTPVGELSNPTTTTTLTSTSFKRTSSDIAAISANLAGSLCTSHVVDMTISNTGEKNPVTFNTTSSAWQRSSSPGQAVDAKETLTITSLSVNRYTAILEARSGPTGSLINIGSSNVTINAGEFFTVEAPLQNQANPLAATFNDLSGATSADAPMGCSDLLDTEVNFDPIPSLFVELTEYELVPAYQVLTLANATVDRIVEFATCSNQAVITQTVSPVEAAAELVTYDLNSASAPNFGNDKHSNTEYLGNAAFIEVTGQVYSNITIALNVTVPAGTAINYLEEDAIFQATLELSTSMVSQMQALTANAALNNGSDTYFDAYSLTPSAQGTTQNQGKLTPTDNAYALGATGVALNINTVVDGVPKSLKSMKLIMVSAAAADRTVDPTFSNPDVAGTAKMSDYFEIVANGHPLFVLDAAASGTDDTNYPAISSTKMFGFNAPKYDVSDDSIRTPTSGTLSYDLGIYSTFGGQGTALLDLVVYLDNAGTTATTMRAAITPNDYVYLTNDDATPYIVATGKSSVTLYALTQTNSPTYEVIGTVEYIDGVAVWSDRLMVGPSKSMPNIIQHVQANTTFGSVYNDFDHRGGVFTKNAVTNALVDQGVEAYFQQDKIVIFNATGGGSFTAGQQLYFTDTGAVSGTEVELSNGVDEFFTVEMATTTTLTSVGGGPMTSYFGGHLQPRAGAIYRDDTHFESPQNTAGSSLEFNATDGSLQGFTGANTQIENGAWVEVYTNNAMDSATNDKFNDAIFTKVTAQNSQGQTTQVGVTFGLRVVDADDVLYPIIYYTVFFSANVNSITISERPQSSIGMGSYTLNVSTGIDGVGAAISTKVDTTIAGTRYRLLDVGSTIPADFYVPPFQGTTSSLNTIVPVAPNYYSRFAVPLQLEFFVTPQRLASNTDGAGTTAVIDDKTQTFNLQSAHRENVATRFFTSPDRYLAHGATQASTTSRTSNVNYVLAPSVSSDGLIHFGAALGHGMAQALCPGSLTLNKMQNATLHDQIKSHQDYNATAANNPFTIQSVAIGSLPFSNAADLSSTLEASQGKEAHGYIVVQKGASEMQDTLTLHIGSTNALGYGFSIGQTLTVTLPGNTTCTLYETVPEAQGAWQTAGAADVTWVPTAAEGGLGVLRTDTMLFHASTAASLL